MGYSLWLEFEEYADINDNDDGFCSITVIHDDGRHEGYSICTPEYFKDNIQSWLSGVEEDGFTTLPDIIVSRLDREHITEVMKQIVVQEQE